MAEKKEKDSVFSTLYALNCNEHTETKKNGSTQLTYLSWPWAWAEVKKRYPDASYNVYKDGNNHPYIEDPDFGLMCYTTVTIEGQTHEMWLPVMNGANKAMRRTPYQYQVWNNYRNQYETKTVEAATMFDINKTIMRCLVKNLAMFGLGLYIYASEDIPQDSDSEENAESTEKKSSKKKKNEPVQQPPVQQAPPPEPTAQPISQQKDEPITDEILEIIANAMSLDDLTKIYYNHPEYQKCAEFTGALTARKDQINKSNKS